MSDIALEMVQVSKKFKRGELHDSLRDLVPDLVGKLFGRNERERQREKEFWALSDVSFQVRRGEAFGIIGGNGAGKSTTLKLLSGILKPTSGRIDVHGRLAALIEVGAGFHQDLTGRENVYLNGTILGMQRDEIDRKFDEIVAFSGLEEFIDTPVKRYSSGMYARLGFAVSAHVEPDILVVDEVLSVGDFAFQQKCMEKMHAVVRSGATIIFVSHNLRAMSELCHRALLLEHGKVVTTGATSDVIGEYMNRTLTRRLVSEDKDIYVAKAVLRGVGGPAVHFQSGDKAYLDVEVVARRRCTKVSIIIFARDQESYPVFHTSSERLGLGNVTLEPGDSYSCTFGLDLHFGRGTYHFGVGAYRHDIPKEYDTRFPAATAMVSCEMDVSGPVNLNPQIEARLVRQGSETSAVTPAR